MVGQTISHYKILAKLGEGGMGVVYKAHDTKLDRLVALKFLSTNLSASEQDKARFIQEAKAASALNHPNVCTIHDVQEHEDQQFIVMEFVDGQALSEKIKQQKASIKQIVDIGIQVAEGLAAAHEKGIVHRDIKPENIMIRKDGIVQIMDFGLAKLRGASRLTKEGTFLCFYGRFEIDGSGSQRHRLDIRGWHYPATLVDALACNLQIFCLDLFIKLLCGEAIKIVRGWWEPMIVVWTDYMQYKAQLRGFDLDKIEKIVKASPERYSDTATGRRVAVGRHDNKLVIIPYEADENSITPVTIHVASREQINFRLEPGDLSMNKTKLAYFENEDVLHLAISDEPESGSIELSPNITAELNDKGELIGIEILNASVFIRDSILESVQAKMLRFSSVQTA